jgi:hypothetical protein
VRAGSQPVGWAPGSTESRPTKGPRQNSLVGRRAAKLHSQSTASDRAGCDGALRILNSLYDSC